MSTINPNDDARIRENRADAKAAFSDMDRTEIERAGRSDRSPEEIESDIQNTRRQMDGTLSQLQRRLTGAPNEMVGEFTDNFRQAVTRNPVPAALLGTGLLLVVASTLFRHRVPVALIGSAIAWRKMYGPEEARREGYQEGFRHGYESTGYSQTGVDYYESGRSSQRSSSASPGMTDKLKSLASSSRERISERTQRLADKGSRMRSQLAGAADRGRTRAGHLSESARGQAMRARSGYDDMLRNKPLMLGLIGVAVGAAVAALAPMTRRENELMGDASDQLAERTREEMDLQLRKGKRVAEAATEAATEAAKEEVRHQQGSSPQSSRPTPGL